MEENKDIKEELKNEDCELSDEQLEQIAGGRITGPSFFRTSTEKSTPIV